MQLRNALHPSRRDGTSEIKRPELLSMRTWEPNRGHVHDRNHGIYIGQHHTRGQHMQQYKHPQTSNNPPRRGKIDMETGRPYIMPV